METWLDQSVQYEGKIVSLHTGTVRLDDGSEAFREVVHHPGGVGVVPWRGDKVLLARQFRVAIGKELIEIPAGKLEGIEDPEHRGRVELEEEIGYVAGAMMPIGHIFPSVGFLSEKIHLFIATDLTETQQNLEEDERIEVVEYSLDEIRDGLRRFEFEDAKTVAGLYALLNYLSTEK